ncbi:DUF167 domain-containing protein [Phaeobacter italicus]|uniref:DUF167 domain-containing protein n=1 Tax=Phaeobacter italicus TaxID=481446 RepID=UPI001CD7F545|nr:DUF167 domain-containing protein [Phaeobacter italicus]MCA0855440.1 DUF167 domain-containing protein [Phaeobacter italicus]
MGKPKQKDLPDLSDLAEAGKDILVRVTPKAARDSVQRTSGDSDELVLKITTTTAPENGKATEAVRKLLATAMRVAPRDLVLLRGATSREKLFGYRP